MFAVDTNAFLYAADHDAHTAMLMRAHEHGIRRLYTRDMDFHRFPFIEILDPLAAPGRVARRGSRLPHSL